MAIHPPPTRLLPIAGLQLLLDNHKLVLFEIAQYYHNDLEFDYDKWFISTALQRFEVGTVPCSLYVALGTSISTPTQFGLLWHAC